MSATDLAMGYCPDMRPFVMTSGLVHAVTDAIRRAKRNKSAGVDELFNEAFKLAPQRFASILCSFWVKCSQLGYLLQAWRTALMIPF